MIPLLEDEMVSQREIPVVYHKKTIQLIFNNEIKIFFFVGNNPKNIAKFDFFVSYEDVKFNRKIIIFI
jgi:hypothetical protein